ncbi:alpha/beta-hydrolase [Gloeophyllum trabeum ATCC 11539]|uniref:Alpha/beta-hydrolase n=1 Tax=Gloeophyllum trabeum (strain ATCC 11539 / FP-39264 / Madison 617) TaxID=670483 RepID=S7RPD2_GLOTA|nr:alpha/beta-hydrolase [Gloeophyllum trabeum ATCC 11539]EPQ54694.1 alpha/beta-hydrolase [Gloeophyllum trabeum ATCC 11539]
MAEQPFKIAVPDEELDLLRRKLDLVRFPDELEDAGWDYGAPLDDVKKLVARWKNGYDWRRHEAELNELPQFTRDIEVDGFGTLNIHYLHQKSTEAHAIPLLFVHGWPGGFFEARKILPLLTSTVPEQPTFHVVVLGLPGYGFSEAPRKKEFGISQFAEVGCKLMTALGYEQFGNGLVAVSWCVSDESSALIVVTQGGDWGHTITRRMARLYGGKHVKAWHTNMPLADPPRLMSDPILAIKHTLHTSTPYSPYNEAERKRLERGEQFAAVGRGYYLEQSTQPQTLGYSLADSPVGLLAWIYEKMVNWSDHYAWDDDEVLTWISIYWFSRAGPAASLRIYYETRVLGGRNNQPKVIGVPMGVAYFPGEPVVTPKSWMHTVGEVKFCTEHPSGGHFAAYEQPEELVTALRKMFGKGGPAFGVVPGKTGYAG